MEDKNISAYYDSVADNYELQYARDNLYDTKLVYPANYFRLQLLINSFIMLKQLINSKIVAITFIHDYFQLSFDDEKGLSIYNNYRIN